MKFYSFRAEMQQQQQKEEDEFKAEPLCSTFMQDYTKDFPKSQPTPTMVRYN